MAVSNYDQHAEHIGPGTVYEEPSGGVSGIVKVLIGTIGLLVVATFSWVIWVAYDEGVRVGAVKTVPVIQADVDEIKRKPDDPGGLVVTTLLGMAGAFVGGFLSQAVGLGAMGSVASFAIATLGAMLLLFGYRLFKGRK